MISRNWICIKKICTSVLNKYSQLKLLTRNKNLGTWKNSGHILPFMTKRKIKLLLPATMSTLPLSGFRKYNRPSMLGTKMKRNIIKYAKIMFTSVMSSTNHLKCNLSRELEQIKSSIFSPICPSAKQHLPTQNQWKKPKCRNQSQLIKQSLKYLLDKIKQILLNTLTST